MTVSQPMSPSPSQGREVGAVTEEKAEMEEVDVPKKSEHERLVDGIKAVQPQRVAELIGLIEAVSNLLAKMSTPELGSLH